MSYPLELSLQKMAHVKLASVLWSRIDVRTFMKESPFSLLTWKNFEKILTENVQELPLPALVKEKLSGFIRPIGMQILKWIQYHISTNTKTDIRVYPSSEFSWTPHGTIDSKETARLILESQTLSIDTCYNLAYFYCLEHDMKKIRDTIPENHKDPDYKIEDYPEIINAQHLADFWTYLYSVNGPFKAGTGSYKKSFQSALQSENNVAAEYFFQKLTFWERKACLDERAINCSGTAATSFIFSHMNHDQLKEIFISKPRSIEMIINYSLYPSFIVKIMCRMWDSVSTFEIGNFSPLTVLVNRQEYSMHALEPDTYRQIFQELWKYACKKFGSKMCFTHSLLSKLLEVRDKKIIEFVSQDVSSAIKKEFILSNDGLNISLKSMMRNNRELLLFFIRQCLSSTDEIEQYKKQFKEFTLRTSMESPWRRYIDGSAMLMDLFPAELTDCENRKRKFNEVEQ